MDTEKFQTDEESLKALLRQTLGREKASPDLRRRVEMLFRNPTTSGTTVRRTPITLRQQWFSRLTRFAIAAMVLLAFGLIFRSVSYARMSQRAGVDHRQLAEFVRAHERCCARGEHGQFDECGRDFDHLARKMQLTAGCKVLAADFVDDGWTYQGGAVCSVGETRAAHLIFSRGGRTLSVFSFDAPGDAREGAVLTEMVDGHAVSGIVKSGSAHYLVGYCPRGGLTCDETRQMLQEHVSASRDETH